MSMYKEIHIRTYNGLIELHARPVNADYKLIVSMVQRTGKFALSQIFFDTEQPATNARMKSHFFHLLRIGEESELVNRPIDPYLKWTNDLENRLKNIHTIVKAL